LATLSNVRFLVEDQVAEGDKVVSRFTVHATHDRKELMDVAPTGREVSFKAIEIHRVSGGKITEYSALGTAGLKLRGQRLEQEIHERERVEQELQVARRIQPASLPKEVPQLGGWRINPFYQPAREVGGDFYDFYLLSGGRLGVVVGDATGKGVPAALVMSTTCGMLQLAAQALDSFYYASRKFSRTSYATRTAALRLAESPLLRRCADHPYPAAPRPLRKLLISLRVLLWSGSSR
jgi:SnoaL-like polyketide cyclase/Stage II sporulation protein E (SpoIIE)